MIAGTKTREKIAGQIKDAADKIGGSVLAALAIAVAAFLIAAAALVVSTRTLRKVTA